MRAFLLSLLWLLAGPALEPLTLDETRLWLRLDASDEDQLVVALIRAARASAAIRSSVETTVAWSVVVPARVISTGVPGARPEEMSCLAMSPMLCTAESSTRVPRSA